MGRGVKPTLDGAWGLELEHAGDAEQYQAREGNAPQPGGPIRRSGYGRSGSNPSENPVFKSQGHSVRWLMGASRIHQSLSQMLGVHGLQGELTVSDWTGLQVLFWGDAPHDLAHLGTGSKGANFHERCRPAGELGYLLDGAILYFEQGDDQSICRAEMFQNFLDKGFGGEGMVRGGVGSLSC